MMHQNKLDFVDTFLNKYACLLFLVIVDKVITIELFFLLLVDDYTDDKHPLTIFMVYSDSRSTTYSSVSASI